MEMEQRAAGVSVGVPQFTAKYPPKMSEVVGLKHYHCHWWYGKGVSRSLDHIYPGLMRKYLQF